MIRRNFETTFAAAAFAEAGEHETAMKMMGITPVYEKVREVVNFFERHFAAVGFAEACCHEDAIRCADPDAVCKPANDSLETFLENVGLGHVRVCYGVASA